MDKGMSMRMRKRTRMRRRRMEDGDEDKVEDSCIRNGRRNAGGREGLGGNDEFEGGGGVLEAVLEPSELLWREKAGQGGIAALAGVGSNLREVNGIKTKERRG